MASTTETCAKIAEVIDLSAVGVKAAAADDDQDLAALFRTIGSVAETALALAEANDAA